MGIPPDKKDTMDWQMVSGLDENGDAQELAFTGDDVNVNDTVATTAIGGVETAVTSIETWMEDHNDSLAEAVKIINFGHAKIHEGEHYFIEGYATLDDGDPDPTTGTLFAKLVVPDTVKWAHFTWEISANGLLETTFWEIPTGGMTGGARSAIHASNRNGSANCFSGRQDGGDNEAVLTDSTASWTEDALIDLQVFNTSDGSSGFITDNDATTVTATLTGGTGNDWDDDDLYEINNSQLVVTSGIVAPTDYGLKLGNVKVGGTAFKSSVGGQSNIADEIILRQNTTYLRQFRSYSDDNIVSFKASWYEHLNK